VSVWQEIFSFNRAETFALAVLLFGLIFGGGILLYQKTSQTLPAEFVFEAPQYVDPAANRSFASASTAIAKRPARLLVNLNTAPAESLMLLPHVGDVISMRIIEYREQAGGFDSVGHLIEVDGIGPKRLADLRPLLTVE
jgi:competence protein ComEA